MLKATINFPVWLRTKFNGHVYILTLIDIHFNEPAIVVVIIVVVIYALFKAIGPNGATNASL